MSRTLFTSFLTIILFTTVYGQDCNELKYANDINEINELSVSSERFLAFEKSVQLQITFEKENLTSCKGYFQILLIKGFNLMQQIKLAECQEIYQSIISNPEAQQHKVEIARAYIENALVQEWIKEEALSHENLDKAKAIIDEYGLKELLTQYYVRRSSINRIFGYRDLAFKNAKLSLDHKAYSFDQRHVRDGIMLYGSMHPNRDTSLYYKEKLVELFLETKDYLAAATTNLGLASSYQGLINKKKRKAYMDLARTQMSMEKDKTSEFYAYSCSLFATYQRFFEEFNEIDSAYYYAKLHMEYQDQFNIYEEKENVESNEFIFNLEQNKKELAETKEANKRFQILSGIGLLIILTILSLLFNAFKNRNKIASQNEEISKKNKSLTELNSKNELLLTEVHHRVKNNLQNIISLLFLQSNKTESSEIKTTLVEVTNKINSIALIHDQLYSNEQYDSLNIKQYVETLLVNSISINKNKVNFENDLLDAHLNIETTIPLGIIITELLTNSSKHNTCKDELKVKVSLKKDSEDSYHFTYQDDGKGYTEDYKKNNGVGLELVKILSRQLYGDLKFSNDSGARVDIIFKEKVISKI